VDCGETDTTGPGMDQHALASLELCYLVEGVVRREIGDGQRRRRGNGQRRRFQDDEVGGSRHVVSEAPEGDGHDQIAGMQPLDSGAHGHDLTHTLVSEGHLGTGIQSEGVQDVPEVEAGTQDPDLHLARRRGRAGPGPPRQLLEQTIRAALEALATRARLSRRSGPANSGDKPLSVAEGDVELVLAGEQLGGQRLGLGSR